MFVVSIVIIRTFNKDVLDSEWTLTSVLPQAVLAISLMKINLVATASNLSDWLWNAIFTAKFDKPDSRLHANEMSW